MADVQQEEWPVKQHFRSFFTQMTCISTKELLKAVLDNSSAEASGPEASEELRDGFALDYILEAVINRKAVE